MSLGPGELLLVLLIALVVLGPDKLPNAARQMGKAIAEMKRMSSNLQSQVHDAIQLDDDETSRDEAKRTNPSNPDVSGFQFIDQKPPVGPSSTRAETEISDNGDVPDGPDGPDGLTKSAGTSPPEHPKHQDRPNQDDGPIGPSPSASPRPFDDRDEETPGPWRSPSKNETRTTE